MWLVWRRNCREEENKAKGNLRRENRSIVEIFRRVRWVLGHLELDWSWSDNMSAMIETGWLISVARLSRSLEVGFRTCYVRGFDGGTLFFNLTLS